MRKKLLTLCGLATVLMANAQFISYVGDGAGLHVNEEALVYNGGGMRIVGAGVVDNKGNIMLVGDGTSKFETVTAAGVAKVDGGNLILRMTNSTIGSLRYGQLYIEGLAQSNITGIVDKQYKDVKHGTYQQIALPFYAKKLSELNTELVKTFTDNRWSQNEILVWNNLRTRMDGLSVTKTTSDVGALDGGILASSAYYAIGSLGFDASAAVRTVKGVPYADGANTVSLKDAALGIDFGTGGNARNQYRERYNTYLTDPFDQSTGAWVNSFGKNMYQYGNPFLTNLDLGQLGKTINNLQGVRVAPEGVVTTSAGTLPTGQTLVTYVNGVAVGDSNAVIRPMQTFVIKLSNATEKTLNLDDLRRFAYTPRPEGTPIGVTARTSTTASTIKQLAVIALDASGTEIGRTYYAVYDSAVTGQPSGVSAQATAIGNQIIGTFEESREGGVDENLKNTYWLYINEANEVDFKGKQIPLAVYSADVKALKFEISENASLIEDGRSILSSGESFYVNLGNRPVAVSNGAVIVLNTPSDNAVYGLYYGTPEGTLATSNALAKPSNTVVAFDSNIAKYRIIFDTTWKTADVQVYDMSGKLVLSQNNVKTANDFIIDLPRTEGTYVVTSVSESGKKFIQKISK